MAKGEFQKQDREQYIKEQIAQGNDAAGDYNGRFLKDAFEACAEYFTDSALEKCFSMRDGRYVFTTIYGYVHYTDDKEEFLSILKQSLKTVSEKYFK